MGKVYLIGAGPGDPGLITLRGLDLIRSADLILYDNLATPALLDYARPDAERVYVGKKRAAHTRSQSEINDLLVEGARNHDVVVRLKGGDPFVFGRGGEEGEALHAAGVRFEVVPGVSSPLGVAAYAGIPLTHRSHTSAVTFVTGHHVDAIDWNRLGHVETLVIFMGLTTFAQIAERLIAAGRSPDTPAAAIRWASRPDQHTVIGSIADLPQRIAEENLKPPALIIVGEVVSLRDSLAWYENLPLFGRRIVVTRASEQSADMAEHLRRLGADPILLPTIEIRPPDDYATLDRAITELETFDWLIFTSRNGVSRFIERLDQSGRDLRAVQGKLAAIGPATAAALEELHLKVDVLPEQYVAESLLEALDAESIKEKKILIPRAAEARDILPETLRERGADVVVAPAYQTVPAASSAAELRRILASDHKPDWITVTSSSTVKNLVEMAGVEALRPIKLASIGPITAKTARDFGLHVAAEADPHTVDALIEAMTRAETA